MTMGGLDIKTEPVEMKVCACTENADPCTEKPTLADFGDILTATGGPAQYLTTKYPTEEHIRTLGDNLNQFFRHDSMVYSDKADFTSPEA